MKLRRWQAECIQQAFDHYDSQQAHFLCLATPGAGKTVMASQLAKRLLDHNLVDLIICFSPSVVVANDFCSELEAHTGKKLNGLMGSQGCSLTYQAMLNLSEDFWELFSRYRVFVIFDEIHHCAGHTIENANAWGEKIITRIQGRALFTLALTGTPWRSDSIPIVLSQYRKDDDQIHCDYQYGLSQAIRDGVCRLPRLVMIDNDQILLKQGSTTHRYRSFSDLLEHSECGYQQLIESEALMVYILRAANKKLDVLRATTADAGGLIVATSVAHARQIKDLLKRELGEESAIATYREDDALTIIKDFKYSNEKWIVSVGMISEGANLPRLRVCCHLTRVKTELYFRQVLGRILRASGNVEEEGFLYMPAEDTLIEYACRVAEDVPKSNVVKFDIMPSSGEPDASVGLQSHGARADSAITLDMTQSATIRNETVCNTTEIPSLLAQSYEATVNIFGRFKQEVVALEGMGFDRL